MSTYHLDLSAISIEWFFETLRAGNISPGRKVLLEAKDERLRLIRKTGVESLGDLAERLKTKPRLAAYAEESGLPEEYLTILRRQALSYLPKPVPLSAFPGVDPNVTAFLAARGITHGRHLFDAVHTAGGIDVFVHTLSATASDDDRVDAIDDDAWRDDTSGVDAPRDASPMEDALSELYTLVSFTRITGVGPVFARMFWAIGLRSLEDLAGANASHIHHGLAAAADAVGYTGPAATEWDVAHCIKTAGMLVER